MTDGIIKGTGNSRYLKTVTDAMALYPTYESFIQALASGTLPIDLNGINTAGWTQQGTPLNKANLLSDDTAAALGLTGDPTVNEALGALSPAVDLRDGAANTFDVGGVFFVTAGYDKPIVDALPATGGSYDAETYEKLRDAIGYRQGGVLPCTLIRSPSAGTGICAAIDPVTKWLYVVRRDTSQIYLDVYDSVGALQRSTSFLSTTLSYIGQIVAYNNVIGIALMYNGDHIYMSFDAGVTVTQIDNYGNTVFGQRLYLVNNRLMYPMYSSGTTYNGTAYYYSLTDGTRTAVSGLPEDIQPCTHNQSVSFCAKYYATNQSGDGASGQLYRINDNGSANQVSNVTVSGLGVVVGEYLYFFAATTNYPLRRMNINNNTVQDCGWNVGSSSRSIWYGYHLGDYDILVTSSAQSDQQVIVVDSSGQAYGLSTLTSLSPQYAGIVVLEETRELMFCNASGELYTAPLWPNFAVPSINISGVDAYVRTKAHKG